MKHELNAGQWRRRPKCRQWDLNSRQSRHPGVDAVKLVHELQLHQIELELQNEELLQARAESQAALERYTEFYDCAPVGYFTLDRDGGIGRLNLAGAELLGSERSRLLNRRFGLFVEHRDRVVFADFLARVFAGGSKECCTVALRDPDGHQPPSFAHLEAVRSESGLTCGVAAFDMTERRRTELLLEQYRDELEATVAERTAELAVANQELEGFLYAASHDMKAPLARLSSLSGLLNQKLRTQLDPEGLVLLDLIQQNAFRLNALVEDLLAHAQIRQQPLSLQAVDVAALAQAIVHEQADGIRQNGAQVRFDFPADMIVRGDLFSLAQVLRNLLENALKYSVHATPPMVEIGGRKHVGRCQLWVRDNGIGIDKAYHGRIFEIFRRLHTYSEYPGTGVGLALVKKAIERVGGSVGVFSEPGQGATFHLEWPF